MTSIDIFIAYSHKDLAFKDELRVHLRPLVRSGRAQVWDDYDIEAGSEWDAAIKEKLFGAQIILLLVSPDSLDSDYFYGKEVTVSLERHARGEAVVVPVILRACLWQQTPLGALEALPTKGRPVASWPSRDDAWHAVAQEVSELIDARQKEIERQSAQEKQRREFAAAAEAADLLFQKENWAEAAKAYADALGLNQPGFLPDATVLRDRMTQCERQVRTVADQQRREQAEQQRRAEEERRRLDTERKAQETAERQRLKEEQRRQAPPNAAPNRLLLYGGLALVGLLLLALWVWQPWKNGKKPDSPAKTELEKTPQPNADETADFNKAAGKIKLLEQFLQKYPDSKYKKDVADQLIPIYLKSARTLIAEDQARDVVCSYVSKILKLDPRHPDALDLKRRFKCQ